MVDTLHNKKYLLITGASSGIGRNISINLSDQYNLILNGTNEYNLQETKRMCNNANNHFIWNFDLSKCEFIENELSEYLSTNKISVGWFVHSAGHMKLIPLRILNLEEINKALYVNTISPTLIIKTLMNKKVNKKCLKNVVFISSNISDMGAKAMSIYGMSKSGLDGLMRCLSIELAPNIRVNSVLPGALETNMTKEMFENIEIKNKMKESYPLGIGEMNDVSNIVDFLLSDKSKWITGQKITVDGGRTINLSMI